MINTRADEIVDNWLEQFIELQPSMQVSSVAINPC